MVFGCLLYTSGSNFEGGKIRIYALYQQQGEAKERAAFLKAEYGLGGHSYTFMAVSYTHLTLGKQMTEELAKQLVNRGKARLTHCYSRKSNRYYDTTVHVETGEDGAAAFKLEFGGKK